MKFMGLTLKIKRAFVVCRLLLNYILIQLEEPFQLNENKKTCHKKEFIAWLKSTITFFT